MEKEIKTSAPEETIYDFVKLFFPDAASKVSFSGMNADIFIASIKCVINIEGGVWQKRNKKISDEENKYFNLMGIPVIWIRQYGSQKLNDFNGAIIDADLRDPTDLFDSIKILYKFLARFVSIEELKDALMNFDVELKPSLRVDIDFDY